MGDINCLGKSKSFRALVDRFQKIGTKLIIRLINGQVELIETVRN